MDVFIDSFEAISPQNTFNVDSFLTETLDFNGNYFSCLVPKYSEYLDPKALRRMSKIVKMGAATAKVSLAKAGVDKPDAIIVGTGLGCVEDTVKFLAQLIENDEQLLNPTAFIQSTHNTVSGQIALMLGCRNYNLTYTQKTASFETAFLDAYLMLKGNEVRNVLVGGIDEVTEDSFRLLNQAGCVRKDETVSKLGYIPGEGSSFFVLSNESSKKNIAKIKDLSLLYNIENNDELLKNILSFLAKNELMPQDIDVVISGMNGDMICDKPHLVIKDFFPESVFTQYKNLVGEYDTASAFSIWVASMILKTSSVPVSLRLDENKRTNFKNILIYHSFNQKNHSLFLLSGC